MRRTKIVATIGPATESKTGIGELVEAGMNIARLNCSHGNEAQFKKIVQNIRLVEKEQGKIISILGDLQGPKIRLGQIKDGKQLVLRGEQIIFSTKEADKDCIHIPYQALPKVVKKNDKLLIEDGIIRTKIVSVSGHKIKTRVIAGGYLRSCKGVNLPDSKMPSSETLTSKDKNDLKMLIKLDADAIALSFVEKAQDILNLKKEIQKLTDKKIYIISKIERPRALKNLKEIIEASDGIMVARGDLGIETKAERVPIEQKRMILMARKAGKPVIVATQILQSMVSSPIATRAEISDAANAIFDHADAFMLSNETAVGEYPTRAVATLARVARETEEAIFKDNELSPLPSNLQKISEDEAMALKACLIAEEINAKAIVVLSEEGFTVSRVLKHRPKTAVIVLTSSSRLVRFLNFFWGIYKTILVDKKIKSEEIKRLLQNKKLIAHKDEIVIIKLSNEKRSLVQMSA